jgi:hypothetical protein
VYAGPKNENERERIMAKASIRQMINENPRGNRCSGCGERVENTAPDIKACLCSTCTAKAAAGIATARAKQETEVKEAKKAERSSRITVLGAVEIVLASAKKRQMHVAELTQKMIDGGLWSTKGSTPTATVYAAIITNMKKKGSKFRKTAPNVFGLI